MAPKLALFICIVFILWLFARDRKLRPMTSWSLWVVLFWIMIIGSRAVSSWFGTEVQIEKVEDYIEGSPLDRNVFLLLIIAGLVVLLRRRLYWGRVIASNKWVFALFLYCGLSLFWSDYPFVSFKRWIKDFGNVVMVLIILTESDPFQATKAVFARYTNFVLPLSVVFIKYFSDIGRSYNRWTGETAYCGITTNKNELGCVLFTCGLFLAWGLIEMGTAKSKRKNWLDLLIRIILIFMLFWLLDKANSSTALVCLVLGVGILLYLQLPLARRQVRYLGTCSLVIVFLIVFLYSVPGIFEAFVGIAGRNTTFTGRTDLWADLLKEPINPLLGTGYKSFWLGPGAKHIWEKYYFHPNQAHNGYLQTYLDLGLIGVCLLIAMIVSAGRKLKRDLLIGNNYGIICFSFLVVALFYNWTEAWFNGLNIIWVIMLIAAFNYSNLQRSIPESLGQQRQR